VPVSVGSEHVCVWPLEPFIKWNFGLNWPTDEVNIQHHTSENV